MVCPSGDVAGDGPGGLPGGWLAAPADAVRGEAAALIARLGSAAWDRRQVPTHLAVGSWVVAASGWVLLQRRRGAEHWGCLTAHVEPGQDPAAAATAVVRRVLGAEPVDVPLLCDMAPAVCLANRDARHLEARFALRAPAGARHLTLPDTDGYRLQWRTVHGALSTLPLLEARRSLTRAWLAVRGQDTARS